MTLNICSLEWITHIVQKYTECDDSIMKYYLHGFRDESHENDMNRLAHCRYPFADALFLITPPSFFYRRYYALLIIHENSDFAIENKLYTVSHDEISMSKFKHLPFAQLEREDMDQTVETIDCGENYFFIYGSHRAKSKP